jgi:hypothetical protein
MLTYEDCLGLSTLTDEEVSAIAEHEHIPRMIAVELGDYLIQAPDGVPAIRRIILDDIANSETRGDGDRALKLRLVLWHFLDTHPDNPKNRPK